LGVENRKQETSGAADVTEERESERAGRDRPATAADRRGPSAAAEIDGRKGRPTPARDGRVVKVSLLARLTRFLREVVAELRKVIWPTRKQMITYTSVVLVFLAVMVALIAGMDVLLAKGVLALFG